mgnify:CR=1 FL=1
MTNQIQKFVLGGAHLNCSVAEIREKLEHIRIFLFDWDGVFNKGEKYGDKGSPFAEADSMGTNLLRLGHWLRKDGQMPMAGILTGAVNQGAEYFAKRECMDVCLRGFNNKMDAWSLLLETFNIGPEEVAYVYDDVIDLPIAEACGLRICVRRTSSPAFEEYVIGQNLCDYITAHEGGAGAVRETCEFLLAVSGIYEEAVQVRMAYGETYRNYISMRKAIDTRVLLAEGVR